MEDWESTVANLKKEADSHFSKGDYTKAIGFYDQAISIDNTNHLLFSNRCAALLKANEKSKALRDGEKCIELNPTWPKGYGRLAAAQFALGRYNAAVSTYENGLVHDKTNSALKDGMKAALAEANKEEQKKIAKEEAEEANANAAEAEDDLLGDFFGEVAEAVEITSNKAVPKKEIVAQDKYTSQVLGSSIDQISRLTAPNYEWKNLNPFNVLLLDVDANEEDIKSRYRKLSTLVHPDKNLGVANAAASFDEVKKAYNLLLDPEKKKHMQDLVEAARTRAKKEFKTLPSS